MPLHTKPNGQTTVIPGVYSSVEVVSDAALPLPAFQVPVLIGAADQGIPYNVASLRDATENTKWWSKHGITASLAAMYGPDSDMAIAMGHAKAHGLPATYAITTSALTRASVQTLRSSTVNEIKIMPRLYGAPPGSIKIGLASGVCTITPIKRFALLTLDASSGDSRVYLKSNAWITPGVSLTLGSNEEANAAYTVDEVGTEISEDGQDLYWVSLTSTLAADLLVDDYAIALTYDATKAEVSGTLTTAQGLLDFVQASLYLTAVKTAEWVAGAVPSDVTAKALKDLSGWATPTAGTSPVPTLTDHQDLITALNAGGWDEFVQAEKTKPRALCVLDSTSTMHAEWKVYAASRRELENPISVMVGCGWGDVVLGAEDDTDPVYRAQALDSQDVALAAGGYNRLGANLTLLPAAWAMRVAGTVPHNLTNDALKFSGEPEVRWDEINSGQLTSLLTAGVITSKVADFTPYANVIVQGLSTLQDNAQVWSPTTNSTPLLAQIDALDNVTRGLRENLGAKIVGAAAVNVATVSAAALPYLAQLKESGAIDDYTIAVARRADGTGWNVTPSIKMPSTPDFVNVYVKIEV